MSLGNSQRFVDLSLATGLIGLLSAMATFSEQIGDLNAKQPLLSAFVQFGILSTYGEAISNRLAAGSWLVRKLPIKAILWGVIGVWIAVAFPFVASGTVGIVRAGLWPDVFTAFSISLWANLFSGYALFMMLTQRWLTQMVENGLCAPWQLFEDPNLAGWAKVVLVSLVVFWVPAHTITFMLPENWRVLFAAVLGVALGLILGVKPAAKPEVR